VPKFIPATKGMLSQRPTPLASWWTTQQAHTIQWNTGSMELQTQYSAIPTWILVVL